MYQIYYQLDDEKRKKKYEHTNLMNAYSCQRKENSIQFTFKIDAIFFPLAIFLHLPLHCTQIKNVASDVQTLYKVSDSMSFFFSLSFALFLYLYFNLHRLFPLNNMKRARKLHIESNGVLN